MKSVIIDGVEYVEKSNGADSEYSMVRTYSAGVFFGILDKDTRSKDGKRGILRNARRVFYLTEIIEVIKMTSKAVKSLKNVPVWTA